MKAKVGLFFFCAILIMPALCQANTVILSSASPNHTVTTGKDEKVYGTLASNVIIMESGARAELVNFPGQNVIEILLASDGFTVSRSGTIVTFQDGNGTMLKIPATTDPQTIEFADQVPLTLIIHDGQVMLDDQVVTATAAAIFGESGLPGPCGAYVAPGVWKEFDCYNLAAIGKDLGHDPYTPSWSLIGGYWQWGRKGPDSSEWHNTNTEHFAHGPTGPGDSQANSGSISGWDSSYAPDGAWSDATKTANDPCPDGYRVPTQTQWDGVIDNNTQNTVGTWDAHNTNYSSARFFGDTLMLPAAGRRDDDGGAAGHRGNHGGYWSSSEYSNTDAWRLYIGSSGAGTNGSQHQNGRSLRCIAEDSSQPANLSLGKNTLSMAVGEIKTVSIRGGTGYYTVNTSNSQVAPAVISGSSVEITGLSSGTATVTVEDTGGVTADIVINVEAASSTDLSGEWVVSAISTTDYGITGKCGNGAGSLIISDNQITGEIRNTWGDIYQVSGTVGSDGAITAALASGVDVAAIFSGKISGNSGSGTWYDIAECSGNWTVIKR